MIHRSLRRRARKSMGSRTSRRAQTKQSKGELRKRPRSTLVETMARLKVKG